jgi:ribose transport system permease protein
MMSAGGGLSNTKHRGIGTELYLFLILAGLFTFLSIKSPHFFSVRNISNLVRQTSVNGIVALGMLFVIVTGGIDLSVGAVVGLSGIIIALLGKSGMNLGAAFAVTMTAGVCVGLVNGLMIHFGRVPAFIATLGSMTVTRGVIMLVSGAKMVSRLPENFTRVAQLTVLGFIPMMFVVWLVMIAVAYFISKHMVFGRNMYAYGSNHESARLSGINISFTVCGVYIFSAVACSVAGILMTSRLANGVPTGGMGYEMDAIAAAVVGGASLDGGEGTVIGTVLGTMIMATIRQGGTLLGINPFVLEIVVGLMIVQAVLIDKQRKKS